MIKYLMISCLAALIDTTITYLLWKKLGVIIVISNTIGVIFGFLLQFVLATPVVFKRGYSFAALFWYLATFLLGLLLANAILWSVLTYFGDGFFIVAKAASMVLPFFLLYYLRKRIFERIVKK